MSHAWSGDKAFRSSLIHDCVSPQSEALPGSRWSLQFLHPLRAITLVCYPPWRSTVCLACSLGANRCNSGANRGNSGAERVYSGIPALILCIPAPIGVIPALCLEALILFETRHALGTAEISPPYRSLTKKLDSTALPKYL